MRMSDCETVDDILTEFAKRDASCYLVWGQKIGRAYREEAKNREAESLAANNLIDALNAQMKELAAECERLRSLVKKLADALFEMNLLGCIVCTVHNKTDCMKGDYCDRKARNNALIAKAREVTK